MNKNLSKYTVYSTTKIEDTEALGTQKQEHEQDESFIQSTDL